MNPTLSERALRRSKQLYWRMHPPSPFGLPIELPFCLIANGGIAPPGPGPTPAAPEHHGSRLQVDRPQILFLELLLVFLDGWFALGEMLSLLLPGLGELALAVVALKNQRIGLLVPAAPGPGLPPGLLGLGPAPGAPGLEPAGCPAAVPGPGS